MEKGGSESDRIEMSVSLQQIPLVKRKDLQGVPPEMGQEKAESMKSMGPVPRQPEIAVQPDVIQLLAQNLVTMKEAVQQAEKGRREFPEHLERTDNWKSEGSGKESKKWKSRERDPAGGSGTIERNEVLCFGNEDSLDGELASYCRSLRRRRSFACGGCGRQTSVLV